MRIWGIADVVALGMASGAAVTATGSNCGTAGVIDTGDYSRGSVVVASDWTTADITFTCCSAPDGTFLPVYSNAGALVRITSMNTAGLTLSYDIPAVVFSAGRYVKCASTNTGSTAAVNQGGARTLTLTLRN